MNNITLLGNNIEGFNIKSCGYGTNSFDLKFKCSRCGSEFGSILYKDRICNLRCKCGRRAYIVPIDDGVDIVDYRTLSEFKYKEIRKQNLHLEGKEMRDLVLNILDDE